MTSELLPPVADVTLILILLCRAALACVFLLAGANKLFDYDTTRRTIADFGLPALLVGPTSLLLPSAEIVVAVLLVSAGLVWWGAVGGSLLLLIFTSAIAVNLALGRTPMCHCFGQLRSRPIGWETVARNVALLLGTMLLLLARPVSREGPVVGMVAHLLRVRRLAVVTGAGALGALVGETSILWMLLRQQGRLLVRLDGVDQRLRSALPGADRAVAAVHGLPVGTRAPSFEVSTAAGPV
ncbi:MAG TPA: MauE/DoxX family redox-associated membrane protein, partial [Vicinamibacterales bacterium]|nr:MauE/DoxX family redox-associated membrane protein [Vicinamibacterales bacterium]